ncbi:hypothetical protein RB979_003715 [Vibrio alginolyticus]|jgi:hypothetical protein|nr:hypothetical protein [Vibrio harveyi]ELA6781462.1 hypothetical protein [Vibrio alginolyticus]MBM4990832.1 hypothetical protein [Vibrio parahaemolyticus]EKO3828764.1 hypothetical protein [Vibrio harveyi]MBM4995225.1 hypothetical protein [Vibrio parahaemolyticus]MDF6016876.1 hypothetical protein [Vibrio harveyi]
MMMQDFLNKYIEAKRFFDKDLPYWCDYFSRPVDEEFADYLREQGQDVTYCVLEVFEQVYIPQACEQSRVQKTALERRKLREQGVSEECLPVLL